MRTWAKLLTGVFLVTALVLAGFVDGELRVEDSSVKIPAAGEKVPLAAELYGQVRTVQLPGSEVTVRVGDPVETLTHEVLDSEYADYDAAAEDPPLLQAPDGGSLVPVSWRIRARGGLTREPDPNPIELRLVVGDRRVQLARVTLSGSVSDSMDALEPTSVAVASGDEVDASELAVEVEYGGHTQRVEVDSGERDAGVARVLYEEQPNFTAGCADYEDRCELEAAPASSLRPGSATFTTSWLTLYPYDRALGWADEGTLWAGVRIQVLDISGAVDASGGYWSVRKRAAREVTLDGEQPVPLEAAPAAQPDGLGRVVFEVDADDKPRRLEITEVYELAADAPQERLRLRARLDLSPVG